MIDYIQIYEQVCYKVNLTWFICLVVEKAFASRSLLVTAPAEVLIVCMVHIYRPECVIDCENESLRNFS